MVFGEQNPDCTELRGERMLKRWRAGLNATLPKKFGRKGSKSWVRAKGCICRVWKWES